MANELILDEGNNPIPSLLQQVVFESNIMTRLQAIHTLCNAVDEDMSKNLNIHKFKMFLKKKYLSDVNFIRQLKLYSKINENVETAIEYHGTDYITHPELNFDEDFEKEVQNLTMLINKFVGRLLKEYAKGENIEI